MKVKYTYKAKQYQTEEIRREKAHIKRKLSRRIIIFSIQSVWVLNDFKTSMLNGFLLQIRWLRSA